MTAQPLRVVVAEDEVLIREGIRRILENAEGIRVLGAVADLTSLRNAVGARRPHVVVTDIRLPPTSTDEGIRFAAELAESNPEVGVVVLSQHVDAGYATRLFEAGATRRAYLLEQRIADPAKLVEIVRTVARGGSYVDVQVVETLLRAADARRNATFENLTAREREILALMAEGRSNGAIARRLAVSNRAVERHVSAIFTKLEIEDSPDFSRRVVAVLAYLSDGHADGRAAALPERRVAPRGALEPW
jgi:DNA-binding NarL/FixJ family response regulator